MATRVPTSTPTVGSSNTNSLTSRDSALEIKRLQVEATRERERCLALGRPVEERARRELRQVQGSERDVFSRAAHHDQSLVAAVRRQIKEAAVEHLPRCTSRRVLAG